MAKKSKNKVVRDPKKESVFKALVQELAGLGYVVRREKLKQGFGWKVVSGECVLAQQGMIFVDSRLTQDEQVDFLKAKLRAVIGTDQLPERELPEVSEQISVQHSEPVA